MPGEAPHQRASRALARVDALALGMSPEASEALAGRLAREVHAALEPLRAAVEATKARVEAEIGALDALSASARERKLHGAMQAAGLRQALEELPGRLRRRLAAAVDTLDEERMAALNAVLREELAVPLGPRLGPLAFEELVRRLPLAQPHRLDPGRLPDAPAVQAVPLAPPAIGLGAILGRRLVARLAARTSARAAAALGVGHLAGVGLAADAAIAAVALGATAVETGAAVREALNREIDAWHAAVERELLDRDALAGTAAAMAAETEQRMRAARAAAAQAIDTTFLGLLAQARSPGYEAAVARSSDAALATGGFAVARVFGTGSVEVDYGLKLGLVQRVARQEVLRQLVQRHGRHFLDLCREAPEQAAAVVDGTEAMSAFAHILAAPRPPAELRAIDGALARFGALDEAQTAALLLLRAEAPSLPAGELRLDGLRRVAVVAAPLRRIAAAEAVPLGPILGPLARGELSEALLRRVLEAPRPVPLLRLLAGIGAAPFSALLAGPAPTLGQVAAYLERIPRELAYRMLAEDGPGSLEAFLAPGQAGGERGVLARESVRRGAAEIGPEDRRLLDWVLARTSIPAGRIDARLLGDVRTLGLAGPFWPDAVAVPAAEILARVRWRWLLSGLLIVLALPPMLGWIALWARLARRRSGRWSAALARGALPGGHPVRRAEPQAQLDGPVQR